jgi:archaellum biogenesis ATPase FlaH
MISKDNRVSKGHPCRHCGKPDWCLVLDNGLEVCARGFMADGWEGTGKSTSEGHEYLRSVIEKKATRTKQRREWQYLGFDGEPLIKVVRLDDGEGAKKIWQEPSGIDHKLCDLLYRNKLDLTRAIFITEGESCVDALKYLGFQATTNIKGRWHDALTESLRGATKVVLCPDRDKVGVKHMATIKDSFERHLPETELSILYAPPHSYWWSHLPDAGGLDIADWVVQGVTKEDIKAAICRDFSFLSGLNESPVDEIVKMDSDEPLTYEQTIQKLEKIFEIEDVALQLWELDRLGCCVKRSPTRLVQIWDTYQNASTPFQPIELHDFLKREELERSWLIAGYIPAGTVIGLIAGGGSGKTLLTYDLIKAIATGQSWNGFRSAQTKVLIVQTDEQFLDTKERLEIANYQEAIAAGTVFLLEKWQFTQFRRLAKFIKEHNIGFCAIDSFTSTNRRSNGEEKDSSYASCIYDLRDLASETKCTFLVLHHTNRAGGSRGTTAFEDNVSETWFLKIPEPSANLTSEHRILEIRKSRSSCNGTFKILLDVNDYSWLHEGDHRVFSEFEDNNSQPPLSARIMEYLEAHRGQHFSPDELIYVRTLSDCKNRDAMRKQLERLRKKGLIDAEDVVKDVAGATGKHRYKIYFAPCVNAPCPPRMEVAPSQGSTVVDTPNKSEDHVHDVGLFPSKGFTVADNHYLHTEDYSA